MQTMTLEKAQWSVTLDNISRFQQSQQVTIEVGGAEFGAQKAAENVTFRGISYDQNDEAVFVMTDTLELMIAEPSLIEIAHNGTHLICIAVLGSEGKRHLVNFIPPLSLPKP